MVNALEMKKARDAIWKAKNVVISGHLHPDGDSLGSLFSLGLALKNINKNVKMISSDRIPYVYHSLPGASAIVKKTNLIPDIAISVDCNSKEFLGSAFDIFKRAKHIIEIDHHKRRRPFGDISLLDSKAASAGEIVYIFLKYLNLKITKDIAQNILTSIIVETNSFRLPDIRPKTFNVCADLMKTGVDFHRLSETVYWSRTKNAALLSAECVSRTKFLKRGKLAWSLVRRKDFDKFKARDEDVETVPNDILAINNVEVVAFFREKSKKEIRVSLRSKGRFNISDVARKYGGGGHFDAAGCFIPNKPGIVGKLLDDLEKLFTVKK